MVLIIILILTEDTVVILIPRTNKVLQDRTLSPSKTKTIPKEILMIQKIVPDVGIRKGAVLGDGHPEEIQNDVVQDVVLLAGHQGGRLVWAQ